MATNAAASVPAGVTKLTKILNHLNKSPKLTLHGVKSIRILLAYSNDHYGVRHFLKDELPRIRYANPSIGIGVNKHRKDKNERWKPELIVVFQDNKTKSLNVEQKASSEILKELMSIAGGDPWKAHVAEAKRSGKPVLPGEEHENKAFKQKPQTMTLDQWTAANPENVKAKEEKLQAKKDGKGKKTGKETREVKTGEENVIVEEVQAAKEVEAASSKLMPPLSPEVVLKTSPEPMHATPSPSPATS